MPLAVAFTEVTERSLAGERRRQLFSDRVFVDRFVEAAIEHRKKVTHRRIGELARFLFGVVDIDVAAENEFFRLGLPSFFVRLGPIVTESVFDLAGCLINLRAR